jgi:hypothetical protein
LSIAIKSEKTTIFGAQKHKTPKIWDQDEIMERGTSGLSGGKRAYRIRVGLEDKCYRN